MGSSRRVSRPSLTPRRIVRRADVTEHHHNPRYAGHCDHKHEDHREDQEKIAHRRISLLNLSSGEPSLRSFEPQCWALLDNPIQCNPIRLRYHCIQDTDTQNDRRESKDFRNSAENTSTDARPTHSDPEGAGRPASIRAARAHRQGIVPPRLLSGISGA